MKTTEQEAFADGRLYIDVRQHPHYTPAWSGHACAGRFIKSLGQPFAVVHVISKPAGGEIRGYVRHGDTLYVRTPSRMDWPEIDQYVGERLGCAVVASEPE
jgi:hypothetical protein